jgi:hypothetical protein
MGGPTLAGGHETSSGKHCHGLQSQIAHVVQPIHAYALGGCWLALIFFASLPRLSMHSMCDMGRSNRRHRRSMIDTVPYRAAHSQCMSAHVRLACHVSSYSVIVLHSYWLALRRIHGNGRDALNSKFASSPQSLPTGPLPRDHVPANLSSMCTLAAVSL